MVWGHNCEVYLLMEPNEKSSLGMDANIAAGLSQILGWLTGLIFFFIETQSKFVKFYAMQMLLLSAGWFVVCVGLTVLSTGMSLMPDLISGMFGLLTGLVMMLGGLGVFILWIVLMIHAFQGKVFKLPVIGQIAEDLAVKSLSSNSGNSGS